MKCETGIVSSQVCGKLCLFSPFQKCGGGRRVRLPLRRHHRPRLPPVRPSALAGGRLLRPLRRRRRAAGRGGAVPGGGARGRPGLGAVHQGAGNAGVQHGGGPDIHGGHTDGPRGQAGGDRPGLGRILGTLLHVRRRQGGGYREFHQTKLSGQKFNSPSFFQEPTEEQSAVSSAGKDFYFAPDGSIEGPDDLPQFVKFHTDTHFT